MFWRSNTAFSQYTKTLKNMKKKSKKSTANNADEEKSGAVGTLIWILNKGTLTICDQDTLISSAQNAFSDRPINNCWSDSAFYWDEMPWHSHRDSITTVIIENGVTGLGYLLFCDCDNLTSVTISNSVRDIEDSAFNGCKSLISIDVDKNNCAYASENGVLFDKSKTVLMQYPANKQDTNYTIPGSVKIIKDFAFGNCRNLASITIPNSVINIGKTAFYDCRNLAAITISNSVTRIGSSVFEGCEKLTSVIIPDSVTNIGGCAFFDCDSLVSVTIPDSVTNIEESAFLDCDSLTSIIIPTNVTSMEDYVFNGCKSLISIDVDKNNSAYTSENGVLFNKSKTVLIQYPAKKTDTNYTIPNSVKNIEVMAFADCCNLISITIPDSVIDIESGAFLCCSRLTSIDVDSNNTDYTSENGILFNKSKTVLIQYPPIHLKENDFECALVHTSRKYSEEYYSFVNSQYTIYGGIHQQAFCEAVVETACKFFNKDFEPTDVQNSMMAAISIRIKNAAFESQTKTILGSQYMEPDGQTIRKYVISMVVNLLGKYLSMNPNVADIILKKILESEKERKKYLRTSNNSFLTF